MTFDTSILDQAIANRKTQWETERQATLHQVITILDEVAGPFSLSQAIIFGSLTQPGRFHVNSDIDIAVLDLPPEHFFDLAVALSQTLERDVDLVELEKVHFADKIRREGIWWTPTD
jgi:predicted nucleotidyltransferase